MTMTNLTPAQAAQQSNRTSDGRYAEAAHPDPGTVDLDDTDLFTAAQAAVHTHTTFMPPFSTMSADDQAKVAIAVSAALAGTGRFGPNPPMLRVDERNGWALHIADTRYRREPRTLVALEFESPADQPHDLTTDAMASGDDGVRALAEKLAEQMRTTAALIGNLPRCAGCKEQATPASVGYWEVGQARDGSKVRLCPDCTDTFNADDTDMYPRDEPESLDPAWWMDR